MADEMGSRRSTFQDVLDALESGKNVYEVIGADDSLVRERVFQELSKLTGKDYDYFYDKWLAADDEEYSDGTSKMDGDIFDEDMDDPREWSASEGEIEIMWTVDYPEFGIESGNTESFVVDYDNVGPDNEYDIENNGLRDEVCRLISDEYPGLDFEPYDFDITNEREFWGNHAASRIYPYDE